MTLVYRYYSLICDACESVIGMNSDPSHPVRGITICSDCWRNPETLPNNLKDTITMNQVFTGGRKSGWRNLFKSRR